jgi:3-deoxy-manno-octulosonate cytidylyltransferase (CMP-KDO synthetase)
MKPFVAIIPARLASTRLPGKMLADIAGIPMVIRVALQARKSKAARVMIATDHADIAAAAAYHGVEVLMTLAHHPSGTDRLAEAAEQLGLEHDDIVVNVQGDEPFINPLLINQVANLLAAHPEAAMSTCAKPFANTDNFLQPNMVKVVCNQMQEALYFSRAPIPWHNTSQLETIKPLHHIGLYAYRAGFLQKFPKLPRSPLESSESLEQLRALEYGYRIKVMITTNHIGFGIDTPFDLDHARRIAVAFDQGKPVE